MNADAARALAATMEGIKAEAGLLYTKADHVVRQATMDGSISHLVAPFGQKARSDLQNAMNHAEVAAALLAVHAAEAETE